MRSKLLLGLSTLLTVLALYMVFIFVPTDRESGVVQRIFYFHVPLAWVAFLAFFMTFLGGILYLARRDMKWDAFSSSSAEVGLVFTTLVLISGSIWARPMWGVWWTWDARLTTSLVLWLIYVAYFMVRSFIPEEERRARFAAVLGVIGFLDVPIVAVAIAIARTQHPSPLIFQGGLAPPMMLTLLVCIAAFTALFFVLFLERAALKRMEAEVKMLRICAEG